MCDVPITMLNMSLGRDPTHFALLILGTTSECLAPSCDVKVITFATCDVLITMMNMLKGGDKSCFAVHVRVTRFECLALSVIAYNDSNTGHPINAGSC